MGVPLAAFIETDLVLVFDHLTHTLSAIASLHTERPDLEGRYRIAKRRSSTRSSARHGHRWPSSTRTRSGRARPAGARGGRGPAAPRPRSRRASVGRSTSGAVETAKDSIAAGEAIQVVLARRESIALPATADGRTLDGIGLYRSLRRVNPSPYLFFVRTPAFEVVGASPELLLQVEGDRLTTHPIAGTRPRGTSPAEDQTSWPSS